MQWVPILAVNHYSFGHGLGTSGLINLADVKIIVGTFDVMHLNKRGSV